MLWADLTIWFNLIIPQPLYSLYSSAICSRMISVTGSLHFTFVLTVSNDLKGRIWAENPESIKYFVLDFTGETTADEALKLKINLDCHHRKIVNNTI